MTAEVAVLNKSAVALATDSAVTISNGSQTLKIFESADKLFELTTKQPLGIMIYNGMQFLGVPLETIIKGFRAHAPDFESTRDAANAFLDHLNDYVRQAPESELASSVRAIVGPIATEIAETIKNNVLKKFQEGARSAETDDFMSVLQALDLRS